RSQDTSQPAACSTSTVASPTSGARTSTTQVISRVTRTRQPYGAEPTQVRSLAAMSPGACIFCEIVAGHRPAHRVLDDEVGVAFLDARPLFPGHTLLVPREHHET